MIDAAVLVRTARERARMSARDLAASSGVSPSTVTRIERGEVNPTVAMLERLLEASGNELAVVVRPGRRRPTMEALRAYRDEITEVVESFGGATSGSSDRSPAATLGTTPTSICWWTFPPEPDS